MLSRKNQERKDRIWEQDFWAYFIGGIVAFVAYSWLFTAKPGEPYMGSKQEKIDKKEQAIKADQAYKLSLDSSKAKK